MKKGIHIVNTFYFTYCMKLLKLKIIILVIFPNKKYKKWSKMNDFQLGLKKSIANGAW